MEIKKGDKVKVIYGSQKGKVGAVERVLGAKGSVLVSGVNLTKKSIKSQGIVEITRPVHSSKVAIICQKCQKETRVYQKLEGGKKNRLCKNCKSEL
jgi:large subunit ribosomal protein L24